MAIKTCVEYETMKMLVPQTVEITSETSLDDFKGKILAKFWEIVKATITKHGSSENVTLFYKNGEVKKQEDLSRIVASQKDLRFQVFFHKHKALIGTV